MLAVAWLVWFWLGTHDLLNCMSILCAARWGNWGVVAGWIQHLCAWSCEISCVRTSSHFITHLLPPLVQADGITRQNVIKLSYPGKKPYFFQLPSSYDFERFANTYHKSSDHSNSFYNFFRWYSVLSELLAWQLTSALDSIVKLWNLTQPWCSVMISYDGGRFMKQTE